MPRSPTGTAAVAAIEEAHRIFRLALTARDAESLALSVAALVVVVGADRACDALSLLARGVAARGEDLAHG